jgi:hypothetical protein
MTRCARHLLLHSPVQDDSINYASRLTEPAAALMSINRLHV